MFKVNSLRLYVLLHLFSLATIGHGQLSLPSSPYLPPNATSGYDPNGSTSSKTQWSNLLGNSIYFYEAQRSGKLPQSNRVSWRNNSATQDGSDTGFDLTGGYYDAGDYIKATFPLTFTLSTICWGALEYGHGYDMANQAAYLDDMLRWGLDWLMKAHPSNDTLYVLVGDANADNAYWGGDQNIPEPRPSFQVNDTSPGTDVAAGASAAFASCAALYNNQSFLGPLSGAASLQNGSYAATLLGHAQQLYAFAVNATGGQRLYQQSVPEVADAYSSSSFGDELTYAALFLAWATNASNYYDDAVNYYNRYSLKGQNSVYNWDSKTPALPLLFTEVLTARPSFGANVSSWQAESERYFDNIINDKGPGSMTKGGLLWYDGDSDDASLSPALGAAMLMSMYAPYATSASKTSAYTNFANGQFSYALGNNPMSCPYIVGSNPNSPQNPHSAIASGGNNINTINTDPLQEAYILYGAVVGGPDEKDQYFDIRSDWPETEPALDINAPILTLAAFHVMNGSDNPFFTSLAPGQYAARKPSGQPCDAAFPCPSNKKLSEGGKIALAVILSLVGLVIIGLGAKWMLLLLRRKSIL